MARLRPGQLGSRALAHLAAETSPLGDSQQESSRTSVTTRRRHRRPAVFAETVPFLLVSAAPHPRRHRVRSAPSDNIRHRRLHHVAFNMDRFDHRRPSHLLPSRTARHVLLRPFILIWAITTVLAASVGLLVLAVGGCIGLVAWDEQNGQVWNRVLRRYRWMSFGLLVYMRESLFWYVSNSIRTYVM